MLILLFKIILDVICGVLNAIGGYCWHNARRYLMPVVIAIGVSLSTGVLWAGLMVIPVMGTLCLGYFGKGFLGRGAWLLLQALVIGLGLFLTHHIGWYFYIPYVIGAGVLGGLLYNIEQVVGDFIFGSWLGLIVFLVH